jgi:hypothetical protein
MSSTITYYKCNNYGNCDVADDLHELSNSFPIEEHQEKKCPVCGTDAEPIPESKPTVKIPTPDPRLIIKLLVAAGILMILVFGVIYFANRSPSTNDSPITEESRQATTSDDCKEKIKRLEGEIKELEEQKRDESKRPNPDNSRIVKISQEIITKRIEIIRTLNECKN